MTVAEKRYKDLQDYFTDKTAAKAILESDVEFKKWLERLKWNVKRCDELGRESQVAWDKLLMRVAETNFSECCGTAEGVKSKVLQIISECRPK